MRRESSSYRKISYAAVLTLFITSVFYGVPAHSANPACAQPTTSTVGDLTVLEFVNPNTNDSNTTGSNIAYTCDWTVPTGVYDLTVVIVGGGGSGGFGNQAGGGGGGEVVYTTNGVLVTPGTTKTITIGAGGAATTAVANTPGHPGADSSYDGVVAHGGGGGGSGGPFSSASDNSGRTGGSTGGGNRFGRLVVAPTRTTATGYTSLGNAGGIGAGKSTNDPASSSQCAPFGAGGGGGGAMSVGGDALASCSDSSTAGSVSVTVGAGGAGAYLLGKCVGGGGASLGTAGTPTNQGTVTLNQASKTPCKDPANNQDVAGTFSGGGSGNAVASGARNTGGGGSGAPLDYGRPAGGSGVVLIAYDASNPPVRANISTQPQSKTILSMTRESFTVAANVNDGGTLSYRWQSSLAGSTTWNNIANSDTTTIFTPILSASSTGTRYRVQITNTKSSRTTVVTSDVATITVNKRTTTLSLGYGDTSTVVFFNGETLSATFSTNSDNRNSATFSSLSPTLCSVNQTTGLITLLASGQCVSRVTVPTNDSYTAASLSVSFNVRNPVQTVTWSALPPLALFSSPVQLGTTQGYALAVGETATGAGAISYSVQSCSSFSITSTGRITPIALGSCRIRALQQGTATFDPGSAFETLTVVATPPDAPFINSVSSSGGSNSNSGSITTSVTSANENGAAITQYVLSALPASGPAIQETLTAGSGTRTITVTGLTLGTSYTVKVKAINSAGASADRTYGTAVTPAGVPFGVSGLSATPGNGSLTIAYTGPASLNGGTWDRYQYFISPTGTAFIDTPTAISTNQADPSYTFTGLTNGAAYDVKVVALTSANGTASSANTTLLNLIPAVAPQAPTISISRQSDTSTLISWYSRGDGGSPITSYAISVTKNSVAQSCYLNLSTTTCTLAGLNPLDAISASATSTNLVGTSPASTTVSYTHSTAVLRPTSISTTSSDSTISISFTQPASGDELVRYEYSLDGSSFTSSGGNSSPITLLGLTNDVTYNIFIRGIGATYGIGATTETITATAGVPAPPPPPPPSNSNNSQSYSPPIVIVETSTAVVDTSTVLVIPETPTQITETKTPEIKITITETTTVISKINIRMEEPFRVNSYFINVVAMRELASIVKKYAKRDVIQVVTIGYSSPSLVNPYPSKLGTWRATAIAKTLKSLGLKSTYTAKYGGLYRGKRVDARKVRIILYVSEIVVTTKEIAK